MTIKIANGGDEKRNHIKISNVGKEKRKDDQNNKWRR
jgi:hypothetical protein